MKTITSKKSSKEAHQPINRDLEKMRANMRIILRCSNATPIGTCKDLGYACAYCRQCHIQPADLKAHTLSSHGYQEIEDFKKGISSSTFLVKMDITGLECTICKAEIDTLESLIRHLEAAHAKKFHAEVKHQILPFKFDGNQLCCCICKQAFSHFKPMQEHMHIHYRNYVCDVCEAGFVTKQRLNVHATKHITGTFACEICGKVFDCLRTKKIHHSHIHVLKKMVIKCGYCDERFRNLASKITHLAKVHDRIKAVNKCNACERTFTNRKSLTKHIRRHHLMEDKHKCTMCDKSFYKPSELKNHTLQHFGAKPFKCDVCSKLYASKITLREHMRIHSADRRFKCELCGSGFVQKCSWKNHMKSKHCARVD